jgi:hypothetical protein
MAVHLAAGLTMATAGADAVALGTSSSFYRVLQLRNAIRTFVGDGGLRHHLAPDPQG